MSAYTSPPKDRTLAGIFAILLGNIGVHKFYVGASGQGLLYLAFFWTLIPGILGLIEGILYLTMNDQEFAAKQRWNFLELVQGTGSTSLTAPAQPMRTTTYTGVITMQTQPQVKSPGLAAVLSFLIPGLGQIYNGEVGKGIVIIVVQVINVILMTVVIGFITGFAVLVWAIYDAYKGAEKINAQAAQQMTVDTKVCPQCAERVQSGARVCRHCGYNFVPETPALTTSANPAPTPTSLDPAPAAAPTPAQTADTKFCPDCGSQVNADAKFCMTCGHKFEVDATAG